MRGWLKSGSLAVPILIAVGLGAASGLAPTPAQSSTSAAYDRLSTGNQKVVSALYEAQKPQSQLPAGAARLTKSQIAAWKQSGLSWGNVFKNMKSQNLITDRNLAQVMESYTSRRQFTAETGALADNALGQAGSGRDGMPSSVTNRPPGGGAARSGAGSARGR